MKRHAFHMEVHAVFAVPSEFAENLPFDRSPHSIVSGQTFPGRSKDGYNMVFINRHGKMQFRSCTKRNMGVSNQMRFIHCQYSEEQAKSRFENPFGGLIFRFR